MARTINPNSNAQLAKAAIDSGLTKFDGSPCIKCAETLRYCSSGFSCVACRKVSLAKYRQANKSKCNQLTKQWAADNADYIKLKRLARYETTGE